MTSVRLLHVVIMAFLLAIPFTSPSFEYSINGGNEKIHHTMYWILIVIAGAGLAYHCSKLFDCLFN